MYIWRGHSVGITTENIVDWHRDSPEIGAKRHASCAKLLVWQRRRSLGREMKSNRQGGRREHRKIWFHTSKH